jgi:hypothetical protein
VFGVERHFNVPAFSEIGVFEGKRF